MRLSSVGLLVLLTTGKDLCPAQADVTGAHTRTDRARVLVLCEPSCEIEATLAELAGRLIWSHKATAIHHVEIARHEIERLRSEGGILAVFEGPAVAA